MTNQEKTQEVLSLKDVLQFELPALFRRQHLNRDMVIGVVGDRGDGKSLSGAVITLLDYLLQGDPCWSNMKIAANLKVNDETVVKYGLKGGEVRFEALPLNKHKFLRFDPEYRNGVFFTDEFNIWLADSRRSMANINLETDDVGQQLRKLQSAWVYTCIHEMFVDNRVRDITDIFIDSKDTALNPEGLARRQPQGIEFQWTIFPISRKFTGERYRETHKALPPVYLRGKQFWGLFDTMERQERIKYIKDAVPFDMNSLELGENPEVVAAKSKWGWLYEAIKTLHDQGYEEIHNEELWDYLQVEERGLSTSEVGRQLAIINVRSCRQAPRSQGGYYYKIDSYDLKKGILKEKREAVLMNTP